MTASPRTIFDQTHYLKLIEARGETIRRVVQELKPLLNLSTALDAGCGVGFFAKILEESGLDVRAFDGREENIQDARRRYPGILFEKGDIEDPSVRGLGSFDLVLCFGLLYHLENPLRAIRHLRALTSKALLLESMCVPGEDPLVLLREEPRAPDQSLTDLAFYPSEGCIVKMCYRVGFSNVLRVHPLPNHADFHDSADHWRRRTVLLAVRGSFKSRSFELLTEPAEITDPWEKVPTNSRKIEHRIRRFMAKPMRQKLWALAHKFPHRKKAVPGELRLPFGARWLVRDDHLSHSICTGGFETAEFTFVDRLLRPGMTVLDIGAHHGFYTLLSSLRVGSEGRVISFEPSPREREVLSQHIRLNGCPNVSIQDVALGSDQKEADLYIVDKDRYSGCNSLRPPVVLGGTSPLRVRVMRLDDWLSQNGIENVDFVKMDVEGGELEVLRGAGELLERRPRPVLLAEVQDIRTEPWGYRGKQIVEYLSQRGFRWFGIARNGTLEALDTTANDFDGNFVACPEEREKQLQFLMQEANAAPNSLKRD